MNRIIRNEGPRKKMKKSRSDKLLTTLRKIDNQMSFMNQEKNFFILPFNKKKENSELKRKPFKLINNNFSNNFKKINGTKAELSNKENQKITNFQNEAKLQKKNQTQQISKIYNNDPYDCGILNEIQARETFMMDTILRSAIINR